MDLKSSKRRLALPRSWQVQKKVVGNLVTAFALSRETQVSQAPDAGCVECMCAGLRRSFGSISAGLRGVGDSMVGVDAEKLSRRNPTQALLTRMSWSPITLTSEARWVRLLRAMLQVLSIRCRRS